MVLSKIRPDKHIVRCKLFIDLKGKVENVVYCSLESQTMSKKMNELVSNTENIQKLALLKKQILLFFRLASTAK